MIDKTIAIRAADDALKNVGVSEEGGDNKGKWIKVYLESVGLPEGYSWCAAFIKFRWIKAAESLKKTLTQQVLDLDGWTPSWAAVAKSTGKWITVQEAQENPSLIKKGYVYCFYSGSRGRIYHVGIYIEGLKHNDNESWDFIGIEGNTAPDSDADVVSNGDSVCRKKRKFSQLGRFGGFIKIY